MAGGAIAASVTAATLAGMGLAGQGDVVVSHMHQPAAWVTACWIAVMFLVGVVHLVHLSRHSGWLRLWHAGHVVMSAAMIEMFWPGGVTGVSTASRLVLAAGAVTGAGVALVSAGRPGTLTRSGASAAIDFLGMVCMSVMPSWPGWGWILTGWFVLQGLGWATGMSTVSGGVRRPRPAGARRGDRLLRASLLAMYAAMVYMFAVMLLSRPMPGM